MTSMRQLMRYKQTLGEVKTAIKGLQNGKVPGIDSTTTEVLKADIA